MFFPRFIKWLAGLPGFYALGLLWWGEATILACSLVGAFLWSDFIYTNIQIKYENFLFHIALLTYFLLFYLIHFTFGKVSQLMEALIDIHRRGGLARLFFAIEGAGAPPDGSDSEPDEDPDDEDSVQPRDETVDPLKAPSRIRASAPAFRIRYFIVLPTAFLLYLLSYGSTIYRIFALQVYTWGDGGRLFFALLTVGGVSFLYWCLLPHLPGYVSIRMLIGHRKHQGE